jgi:CelD/BcsL family acetyltransferase involved in cellulose biosynthesis
MTGMGFHGQQLFTYQIRLFPQEPDHVLKSVHRRTRTYFRALSRQQFIAASREGNSLAEEFYQQSKCVFARRGSALPFGRERVVQLFRSFEGDDHFLALGVRKRDNDACIATGIFLLGERQMHLWGWTYRKEYGALHPTELLAWTAMQYGMAAGCRSFDLGGPGKAKVKFGGAPDTSNHRWTWSRYKWLPPLRRWARAGYRWQQGARGGWFRLFAEKSSGE